MLMPKSHAEATWGNVVVAMTCSFVFWSVLWWVADWFQKGSGLRNVNLLIVAAVSLSLGYKMHGIGLSFGLAVVLPAAAIVAMERGFQNALWSVLIAVCAGWVATAEEIEH